tara:strand:- start:424 stop:969 length:546 start_codon:yes stop_codon:yes gene_type:complete
MACVYKIICKDNSITDCYIGSTGNFKERRKSHKKLVKNSKDRKYNMKIYKCIRENGGWDNWSMIKIEDCEEDNKVKLEQKYYEELQPSLNSKRPLLTEEQRIIRDRLYMKEYNLKNKDKLLKNMKEYNLKNKDKIAKKGKAYRLKNKDELAKKGKAYRLKNKDELAKRRKERNAKKKLLKK